MEIVLEFICSEMARLQADMEYYEDMGRIDAMRYICDMEISSKLYELLRKLHDEGIITLRDGYIIYKNKKESYN